MQIPELDPRTAHAAIASFRILDVREDFEFEGPLGALAGAVNVPLGEVAQYAGALDASDHLLLVCRSGRRSETACRILRQRGMPDVTNLAGGMIAWNGAALPVVRRRLESAESLRESLTHWLAQVSGVDRAKAGERMAAWLQETGPSTSGTTREALERLLARVEQALRQTSAPADLDLTMDAYRRDLAAL